MHFWNNQSVVIQGGVFMKMHQFQWFFPFFVKSFQITIHKKFIKESFMNLFFVTPDGRYKGNIPSFSWITLSFKFLGIIIRKCFSKRAKITEISALSENYFYGNKTLNLKRILKDFRSLFYQMDHIWGAPSLLKRSLLLIFLEQ